LLSKLRYLAVGCKCDFIILDHISIVVSGQESSSEGERKDIDILMTNLRSLVENTGVGVIAIVHLSKPPGVSHEEGGRVTLSHLRGSGSLKQLPDNVVAMERDQQSDTKSDESTIRVLKNREFGELGLADTVVYDRETGRLRVQSR
jgi:twinkle protein